jgi:hypothetical protein
MFTMCDVSAQEFLDLPDAAAYLGVHTETPRGARGLKREQHGWVLDASRQYPTYMRRDDRGNIVRFKKFAELESQGVKTTVLFVTDRFVRPLNA